MNKLTKKQIGLRIGEYVLLLTDPHEVFGHDDSFPYNTNFNVFDSEGNSICSGTCYNDGWGGLSEYTIITGTLPVEFVDYIKDNFMYSMQISTGVITHHLNFTDTVDYLVYAFLDIQQFKGKIVSEEDFKNYINC